RMVANLIHATGMLGASLIEAGSGKALSDRPALEPYWGKLAVRNLRGDDGNGGIIRSPIRAIVLPDPLAPTGSEPVLRATGTPMPGTGGGLQPPQERHANLGEANTKDRRITLAVEANQISDRRCASGKS